MPEDTTAEEEPQGDGTVGPQDDGGDPAALLAQLGVRRHATIGVVVATALAAVVYAPWALRVWIEGTDELLPAVNFLSLTFVLWFAVAFSIATALTARAGLRPVLDHEAWLRRGGASAMLGGGALTTLPAIAALEPSTAILRAWAIGGCLLTIGGAIGLHASVKTAAGRLEAGGYLLTVVGLTVAAANATGSAAPTTAVEGTTIASPFLLGTTLALVGTVAFAAGADLAGRLPTRPLQALLGGALAGTLAAAWLFALGGLGVVPPDWRDPAVLALVLAPAGLGWIVVGRALQTAAGDVLAAAPPGAPSQLASDTAPESSAEESTSGSPEPRTGTEETAE